MNVNQRVQYAIISSKKKLTEIAKFLGVSQPSVTRYVNGSQKPGDELLKKLAEATGQNYEWLKTGSGKVPLGFKDFIGSTGLSKEELVQKIENLESKAEKLQSEVRRLKRENELLERLTEKGNILKDISRST